MRLILAPESTALHIRDAAEAVPPGQSRIGYRPELQGLRALSVILVAAYHIWPSLIPGGFVGVDVFFVISGFLISGLLLKESERTGGIDLLLFWGRRIRRLLPAACLVLLVALAGTVALLPPTLWLDTAREILSSALYVQNWNLAARAVDYTARATAVSPVQHYWSLSIEEQFYLVWPVLVFALSRLVPAGWTRRAFGFCALLVFVASLSLSVAAAFSASSAYFVTTTRAWELALGGLLAAIETRLILPDWYRVVLSWCGIAAILIAGFLMPGELAFPGWVALLPTLGAVLVIAARQSGQWSLAPILSWAPVQYLGDISYSIYLWHWPVIVFLPLIPGVARFSPGPAVFFLVSILLAALTKVLIEDPFRVGIFASRSSRRWPAYVVAVLLVGPVSLLAGGLFCQQKRDLEARARLELAEFRPADGAYPGAAALDPGRPGTTPVDGGSRSATADISATGSKGIPLRPDPLVASRDVPRVYNDGCDLKQTTRAFACEYGDTAGKTTVALVGDSHAAQYLPALESLASHYHWRILVFEKSACFYSRSPVRIRHNGIIRGDCEAWKEQVTDQLLKIRPDVVITSAALPVVYNDYYMLASSGDLVQGYQGIWKALTDRSIPVLVIRDNPRPLLDVPTCAWQNRFNLALCAQSRQQILDRHPDPILEASGAGSRVHSLDLSALFCPEGRCPVAIGNVLVYRDGDHLTATYARTLAPFLDRKIRDILPKK